VKLPIFFLLSKCGEREREIEKKIKIKTKILFKKVEKDLEGEIPT
jgi:hypothetical protein